MDFAQLRTTTGSSLPPQTLLLHTYEIESLLASGGMGEVYLARHVELGTRHAIKIIRPELIADLSGSTVLELFRREAAILRGIRNDAVVGYDGFLRDEQKKFYLITEYVDGPSLAEILRQRALSLQEIDLLLHRLCKGLAVVHERGIIHRDISPDNVILPKGDFNTAKLIDFGIAKLNDPGNLTILGNTFAGKLCYAAPEQLGLFRGVIGPATDIYSLGLVLAASALGQPLYMGDSIQTALEARQKLPNLEAIPAALQPLLLAMLQPDPADRPQQVTALLQHWSLPPAPEPDTDATVIQCRHITFYPAQRSSKLPAAEAATKLRRDALKRDGADSVPSPRAEAAAKFRPDTLKVESPLRTDRLRGLAVGVGITLVVLALSFGVVKLLEPKPPAAPAISRTPEHTAAEVRLPEDEPAFPAAPLAPEVKATGEMANTTLTPEISIAEPPAAAPLVPEVKETGQAPGATEGGGMVTSIPSVLPSVKPMANQQPLSPPAKPVTSKPVSTPKNEPPIVTNNPQPRPKPSSPGRPIRVTSGGMGDPQKPSNKQSSRQRNPRCGEILSRQGLGEQLSSDDLVKLKECK